MMDIYFNELSAPAYLDTDKLAGLIDKYAKVIKEAKEQGFDMVRYENGVVSIMLDKEHSLAQYLYEHPTLQSVKVLLATQAKPYISDGDNAEDAYIMNDYAVEINNQQIKCEGLVAAAINNSMSIGFENPNWKDESYNIIESNDTKTRKINVLYAFDASFFQTDTFQLWSDVHLPPTIQPSGLLPSEKGIHLSHHHGNDVLEKFAKRIRKENYIKEIINSIDRDSNQKQFARGKEGTNIVEITLLKDGYYGLAVSTTARNDKELRYIVKLITEKYS